MTESDSTKRALAQGDAETLAQMRAAPPDAIFVIHHRRAAGYFTACAEIAERRDLRLISLDGVGDGFRWRAMRFPPPFVVDHYAATVATPAQLATIAAINATPKGLDRMSEDFA